jgi:hypothetical protein
MQKKVKKKYLIVTDYSEAFEQTYLQTEIEYTPSGDKIDLEYQKDGKLYFKEIQSGNSLDAFSLDDNSYRRERNYYNDAGQKIKMTALYKNKIEEENLIETFDNVYEFTTQITDYIYDSKDKLILEKEVDSNRNTGRIRRSEKKYYYDRQDNLLSIDHFDSHWGCYTYKTIFFRNADESIISEQMYTAAEGELHHLLMTSLLKNGGKIITDEYFGGICSPNRNVTHYDGAGRIIKVFSYDDSRKSVTKKYYKYHKNSSLEKQAKEYIIINKTIKLEKLTEYHYEFY